MVTTMKKFKDLQIRTKIYSLSGLLIFLALVIMGIAQLRSNAQNEIIAANGINNFMLEARRSEKDFFTRKDLAYVNKVSNAYQGIIELTNGNTDPEIINIAAAIKSYSKYFQELVQIEKEIGLDENSGLQGTLREAVHSIEAYAKKTNSDKLMVQMLMARRHEKDFMLRGKEKYIAELDDAVNAMMKITRESNLPEELKSSIIDLATNYKKSFHEYADKIDVKNTAMENLKNEVHKIDPLVASIVSHAKDKAAFWNSTSLIITLVAILIGAFLAYFITNLITKPIQKLAAAADAFTNGDTDIEIEVLSNDEIGRLSKTMNKMIEQIGLQIEYLDNLPTPVLIIDKEFNIQYANKFACELVDKTKDECLSSKCYDLMNADHCKTGQCQLHQAMNDLKVHGSEQVARPNGKTLDIMYTGTPIHNKAGELIGAMEFVADISVVKEAEKYLDRSTKTIMEAMELFAAGDLTVQIQSEKSGDNIAKLFESFNLTIEKIKKIILDVTEAISATASASTQISSSTEEMAAGAQEQSAQTGEVSAAIEQMAATIVESSKNASNAADLANNAGNSAKTGGQVVYEPISGIEKITEVVSGATKIIEELGVSSNKIGEITQVIDDIADQTNLLALNAAIEAARAGEQGRGFAVVADEVRKLAERTTKATKEIAEMITQIQKQTENAVKSMRSGEEETAKGKDLALKAGNSLKEIVDSSEQVIDAIEQVAATSEEQSSTIEQVSRNVDGINSVAHETASGIEQVAKASEDLNQLTENLQQLVNQFKVDQNLTTRSRNNFSSGNNDLSRNTFASNQFTN